MKIENGINPNCSETVIRINEEDALQISPELMSKWWSMSEPTEGYSHMRPIPGTRCFYFYQTCGDELIKWCEDNKIGYDIEAPFGEQQPEWEEIEPNEEEKELPRDGGGGFFYRRKPYAN